MVTIVVPRQWTKETVDARFQVDVDSVGEAVRELRRRFPGLERWLDNGRGSVPSYTHAFLGERDVRTLAGDATPTREHDVLYFMVAMSGG
jgi:molybdopterin converting factor small subunit